MPHIPHTLKGINNIYDRTAELPRWRAQARHPRTALSSLLSTFSYRAANAARGALKRAIHALPSTLSSLLSTLEAHCIVATHYPFPSPPYSLLLEAHCIVATHYPLPSSPFSLLYHSLAVLINPPARRRLSE